MLSAHLSVLSSSSRGNCSALVIDTGESKSTYLIDCGLSPRRTFELLHALDAADVRVDGVLLTHLDADHCHAGWIAALPQQSTLHLHRVHRSRAERQGFAYVRSNVYDEAFELCNGVTIHPILNTHDDQGSVAFRFEFASRSQHPFTLGYATDLGRPSRELVKHLHRVDVLAIESNYCPEMQLSSNRPQFLKDRIMNGGGHLSNHESAAAARAIAPSRHLILLHLSLECNTPEVALRAHTRHPQAIQAPITVSCWDQPTKWIEVAGEHLQPSIREVKPIAQTLWG